MPRLTLCLTFHNHQPVGNLDDVFEVAWARCYDPLADALLEAPAVKVTMHHTGPLLSWLWARRPEYLQKLRALVSRGQVELLGGGFYEPMLPVLPERDAMGQIERMRRFCVEHLGQRPRGAWLPERVWEPEMARLLHRAQVEYTLVDEEAFPAGTPARPLSGHYLTEKAGHPLRLFPIDAQLRDAIPFRPVEEIVEGLRQRLQRSGREHLSLTWADDGEKFGLWPGTFEWVVEGGWLRELLSALTEAHSWLSTATLGEQVDAEPPGGRVYLPSSSYPEMSSWALTPEADAAYRSLRERLRERGELDTLSPFLRGGTWASFLARYPESNALHKKAIRVSRKLHALSSPRPAHVAPEVLEAAREDLFAGQCNCALWHGLFGGVYLGWLRAALHEHLIRAESSLDQARHGDRYLLHRVDDLDLDGHDELFVASPALAATLAPRWGAALTELDLRRFDLCPTDVLTRRLESYHREADAALAALVVHDARPRLCFIDSIAAPEDPDAFLEHLQRGTAAPLVDLASPAGAPALDGDADTLRASFSADRGDLRLSKRYTFASGTDGFDVHYTLSGELPEAWLCVAFNLTLHTPDAPDRALLLELDGHRTDPIPLNQPGHGRADAFAFEDQPRGLRLSLTADRPATLFHYPVETASRSEAGLERTWQGTCVVMAFPLDPDQAPFHLHLRLDALPLDTHPPT